MRGCRETKIVWIILASISILFCGKADAMFENQFIFFPERTLSSTPGSVGLPYKEVIFAASDEVSLHGWYVPGKTEKPLVLFFHGNAGNISHRLENLRLFHDRLGVSVFIFDYRGYGKSDGKPSEAGIYQDARGAWKWLESRGWTTERMIYFGRSLGAAAAVQLALEAPPSGLALETPFPSIGAVGRHHYPLLYPLAGWAVGARFDSLSKMDRIRVPLLVLQGDSDRIVPEEMARQLFQRANEPKTFHLIEGAGHNDTFHVGGESYWDAWRNFLETIGTGPRGANTEALKDGD